MSSVHKISRDKWRARWRTPEGNSRSKMFTREKDALGFLATVDHELKRGMYVDLSSGPTVSEFARQWAESRPVRVSTARTVQTMLRQYIDGMPIGRRPIAQVRPSEVQAWVKALSDRLSPSTLHNVFGFLRNVFDAAIEDGYASKNPVTKSLSVPKRERRKLIPLTVEQVQTLADHVPGRYRAVVLTQAGLGLRIGECLALCVQDIDWTRRLVRLDRQLVPGTTYFTDVLKTPSSRRTMPLTEALSFTLAQHIATYPPREDGALFTTTFGGCLRHDYYGAQVFKRAVLRAGLPASTVPHGLRHHYASVLVSAGVSVFQVSELLGHDNPTEVLKTYGHLMPGSDDIARRVLDSAWNAVRVADVSYEGPVSL